MAAIINGRRIDPTRVDIETPAGQWVQGVDLANIPAGTPIKSVKRVFAWQSGRVYVYRSEFIDQINGTVKEVISRSVRPEGDVEIDQKNTVGLVESPLSVELWDIT